MLKKALFSTLLLLSTFSIYGQSDFNSRDLRDDIQRRADVKTDGTKKDTRTDPRSAM